jgi:23S rRNA pseudouridine1911/1915/1917 synthase
MFKYPYVSSDKFLQEYFMKHELQILYEDDAILVCFKPHGLATQSRNARTPDLERMILNHIAAENLPERSSAGKSSGHSRSGKSSSRSAGAPYLAVIHRLDQPVSGILVFARTPEAARSLNKQLTGEGFGKHYQALVEGTPPASQGTLTDYMVKDSRSNLSRICTKDTPGAKQARLHYQVLSTEGSRTLLEVVLDTGRHHQIRVQLAHMGCPIVGDTKYNPNSSDDSHWQTIQLCAYKLAFRHPTTGKPMEFQIDKNGQRLL